MLVKPVLVAAKISAARDSVGRITRLTAAFGSTAWTDDERWIGASGPITAYLRCTRRHSESDLEADTRAGVIEYVSRLRNCRLHYHEVYRVRHVAAITDWDM